MNSQSHRFGIVVVGAGPAGIAAACEAAERGQRVAVIDESPGLGGQIWRSAAGKKRHTTAARWFDRLTRSNVTHFNSASVVAAPQAKVLRVESGGGNFDVAWRSLILAVGARELFLPFPGWTLPNVFGVGGLQALAKSGWPIAGKRVLIAGSGPLLLAVADGLQALGARVTAICEQAPWPRVRRFGLSLLQHPSKLSQALALKFRLRGIPYRCATWPVRAEGDSCVRSVVLTDGTKTWSEECDYLACGFGLVPNVELPLLLGCELADGFVRVNEHQATTVTGVYCAGEPTGIGGADCALVEGAIAGLCASGAHTEATNRFAERAKWHRFREQLRGTFALEAPLTRLAQGDTIVCRCEDVTHQSLARYASWREAKLQTRCGMGPCQGRVCGAATRVLFGWGVESVRPPVLAARVSTLARPCARGDVEPVEE